MGQSCQADVRPFVRYVRTRRDLTIKQRFKLFGKDSHIYRFCSLYPKKKPSEEIKTKRKHSNARIKQPCLTRVSYPPQSLQDEQDEDKDEDEEVFTDCRQGEPSSHELSSLLRFSLRFKRSTRLWCIFSAIFSYRAFSSLAARRSLMRWIWDCRRRSTVSFVRASSRFPS